MSRRWVVKDGFKKLSSDTMYRGRLFDLQKVRMRAPSGREFRHDLIQHPGAVVIVPVLKGERFVLIKQFRSAAGRIIWEFPAGTLERGESPLACAKREIEEETGFRASRWQKLTTFYPAPGISTELMHLFLARDLVEKRAALDRDEFIERRIIPLKRLESMIVNGTIVDAKTMIGFFYYSRRR